MGPTLIVFVPTAPALHELDDVVHSSAIDVTRLSPTTWSFWLAPGTCNANLAVVPFGTEADGNGGFTEPILDPADQRSYAAAVGFHPAAAFQLDNGCRNDPLGHVLLGRLAASLARQWLGLIDLGSVKARPHLGSYVAGVLRCAILSNGAAAYLCDGEFMEAWTCSEAYYLEA
ncbi:MAG: DUF6368 family protein [Bryobacteraceae bacterium]